MKTAFCFWQYLWSAIIFYISFYRDDVFLLKSIYGKFMRMPRGYIYYKMLLKCYLSQRRLACTLKIYYLFYMYRHIYTNTQRKLWPWPAKNIYWKLMGIYGARFSCMYVYTWTSTWIIPHVIARIVGTHKFNAPNHIYAVYVLYTLCIYGLYVIMCYIW